MVYNLLVEYIWQTPQCLNLERIFPGVKLALCYSSGSLECLGDLLFLLVTKKFELIKPMFYA